MNKTEICISKNNNNLKIFYLFDKKTYLSKFKFDNNKIVVKRSNKCEFCDGLGIIDDEECFCVEDGGIEDSDDAQIFYRNQKPYDEDEYISCDDLIITAYKD